MPRTRLEVSGVCMGVVVVGESVVVTEESLTGGHLALLLLQVLCVRCTGCAFTDV